MKNTSLWYVMEKIKLTQNQENYFGNQIRDCENVLIDYFKNVEHVPICTNKSINYITVCLKDYFLEKGRGDLISCGEHGNVLERTLLFAVKQNIFFDRGNKKLKVDFDYAAYSEYRMFGVWEVENG